MSPFDPLVFHRPRVESLFGVRYRLGIYTPAPQRTRGYYSLLFLLGLRLAAQVDLKADRSVGELLVRGVWSEDPAALPGHTGTGGRAGGGPAGVGPLVAEREVTARELAGELLEVARWRSLQDVVVEQDAAGDLTGPLQRALRKLTGI